MVKKDTSPEDQDFEGSNTPWTQQETHLLHEMVQEYARMRWLKKKVVWWAVWILGLPSAALMVWEPIARLLKILKGGG